MDDAAAPAGPAAGPGPAEEAAGSGLTEEAAAGEEAAGPAEGAEGGGRHDAQWAKFAEWVLRLAWNRWFWNFQGQLLKEIKQRGSASSARGGALTAGTHGGAGGGSATALCRPSATHPPLIYRLARSGNPRPERQKNQFPGGRWRWRVMAEAKARAMPSREELTAMRTVNALNLESRGDPRCAWIRGPE